MQHKNSLQKTPLQSDEPPTTKPDGRAWLYQTNALIASDVAGPLTGLTFAVKDNMDWAGVLLISQTN